MKLQLWTDGACSPNPGKGGWAAILVATGHGGTPLKQLELSGAELVTTNNRMELQAVISGLEALSTPSVITVHLDSAYVMNAVTKKWVAGWQRKGWITSNKTPVANRDLWERLIVMLDRHQVKWAKVKGHAGVPLNERCDQLAVSARTTL
jgi:ribonuclease HI